MKKVSFAVSDSSMAYIVIGHDGDFVRSGYCVRMNLTNKWVEELANDLFGAVLVWVGEEDGVKELDDVLTTHGLPVTLAGQVSVTEAQVKRQQADVICSIGTIMFGGQRIFENDTKYLATAGAMLQERNPVLKEQIQALADCS